MCNSDLTFTWLYDVIYTVSLVTICRHAVTTILLTIFPVLYIHLFFLQLEVCTSYSPSPLSPIPLTPSPLVTSSGEQGHFRACSPLYYWWLVWHWLMAGATSLFVRSPMNGQGGGCPWFGPFGGTRWSPVAPPAPLLHYGSPQHSGCLQHSLTFTG